MQKSLYSIVKDKERNTFQKEGMIVSVVPTVTKGFTLAKELLYKLVDTKTVLYLSGGKTPKELYVDLAHEEVVHPGAVGLVDERYGEKFHDSSNEKMLRDSRFLRYLEMRDIPFYPMLIGEQGRVDTARTYDEKIRELNTTFTRSIATLGIGLDGHTAGIAGNRDDFTNPLFSSAEKDALVSEFDDETGMFKQRVTMTFLGLSMMDVLIVIVFGADKKEALQALFSEGSEEEVPSRFLKRPEVAEKTILITDQNIL